MLLEICLDHAASRLPLLRRVTSKEHKGLFTNYKRLAVAHATSQIVAHSDQVLREWEDSFELRERVEAIRLGQHGSTTLGGLDF
jgi:hypothetical protein